MHVMHYIFWSKSNAFFCNALHFSKCNAISNALHSTSLGHFSDWVCTLWWKLFPLLKSFHQRKFLSTISFHLLNCVNSYWFILFRIYPYVNKQLNVNKQLKEIFFDENFSHFLSLWWKLFPLLKSFHQRKFLSTISFHLLNCVEKWDLDNSSFYSSKFFTLAA